MSANLPKLREDDHGIIPVPATSTLEIIDRIAANPNVDVEKLRSLLQLKREIEADSNKAAFFAALKDAQEEMKPVVRDAENLHTKSKYARLETIDEAIRPIYSKHGFSLTFNSPDCAEKGSVTISCSLLHDRGHSRDYQLTGGLDTAGAKGASNKTDIQGLGSSVSYLRRYLTCMIFNIVLKNEDKDGNRTASYITQREADEIEDKIALCGLNDEGRAKFLEFMDVKAIADITRGGHYGTAINFLNAKIREIEKRAGRNVDNNHPDIRWPIPQTAEARKCNCEHWLKIKPLFGRVTFECPEHGNATIDSRPIAVSTSTSIGAGTLPAGTKGPLLPRRPGQVKW